MTAPLTPSDVTALVRDALSARPELEDVLVEGEISNLSTAVSGHLYFTLKDARSALRCVCFRTAALRIPFHPENGLTVVAHGSIGVYERNGDYQLHVDRLEPSGVGALALAVEQLKRRLSAEGLFDERRKRPLPLVPRRVVVVTSRSGAALRDVCTVLSRRAPVDIVLSPATVQGDGAAETIVRALQRAAAVRGAGVILLVRGGGSVEDLMAFNSEQVARAIRASPLPVVTGVGHETDTTVADLAADRRAATPSAAAELVVPASAQLRSEVARRVLRLSNAAGARLSRSRERLEASRRGLEASSPRRRLAGHRQELDNRQTQLRAALLQELSAKRRSLGSAGGRLAAQSPAARIRAGRDRVAAAGQRLRSAAERTILVRRSRLERGVAQLQALSPLRTLQRGYSITLLESGAVAVDSATVPPGAALRTVLHRGELRSRVTAADRGEQMYDTEPGGSNRQ